MRVRIAQCLCGPKARHAITAIVVDEQALSDDDVLHMLRVAVIELIAGAGPSPDLRQINPYCALCGAPPDAWIYEVAWSKEFSSWEEAQRVITAEQSRQRATTTALGRMGLSYESRRRKAGMN